MLNRGGRAPSGPWGRLKPVEQDALESIGLPSKGDTRLLDLKIQEWYYTRIVERYMTFCSSAGERDELRRRFASLHETTTPQPQPQPIEALGTIALSANAQPLSEILSALRKLREGIVASGRYDDFSTQAYLFSIRLGILAQHPQTYHPSILHVLSASPINKGNIRGGNCNSDGNEKGDSGGGSGSGRGHSNGVGNGTTNLNLTSIERTEVISYQILDAACRRGNLAEAYAIRGRWKLRDARVDNVLGALAHDNYVAWRRMRGVVDGYKARLMDWAEDDVRRVVLKCFGRSYLGCEREWLEKCAGKDWEKLRDGDGVGWELEGGKVVIRKVKR